MKETLLIETVENGYLVRVENPDPKDNQTWVFNRVVPLVEWLRALYFSREKDTSLWEEKPRETIYAKAPDEQRMLYTFRCVCGADFSGSDIMLLAKQAMGHCEAQSSSGHAIVKIISA